MSLLRSLFLALVLAAPLLAAEFPPPSARAKSGLTGMLVTTTHYAYRDVWHNTPSDTAPSLAVSNELVPGQRLEIAVAFGGAAVNAKGEIDVVFDLVVVAPDGTETVAGRDLVAGHFKPANPNFMFLADAAARYLGNPGAPGEYHFVATLKDRVSKTFLKLGQKVVVMSDAAPTPLPARFDAKAFDQWMTNYYLKPEPRLFLPAFGWFVTQEELVNKQGAWPPLLGFCEMLLQDNPWLVDSVLARVRAPETPGAESGALIFMLAYVFRDDATFADRLPEARRDDFRHAQRREWPVPAAPIASGEQMDVLWGRFFATGALAPIKHLTTLLDYHIYATKLEEFKKLDPKPREAPPEVLKSVLFSTALWSLKSNAGTHRLVRNYLVSELNNPKGNSENRAFLAMTAGVKIRTADGREIDFSQPPPKK